jgi:hypothetical protein
MDKLQSDGHIYIVLILSFAAVILSMSPPYPFRTHPGSCFTSGISFEFAALEHAQPCDVNTQAMEHQ